MGLTNFQGATLGPLHWGTQTGVQSLMHKPTLDFARRRNKRDGHTVVNLWRRQQATPEGNSLLLE